MTDQIETTETTEQTNHPDWIAKTPKASDTSQGLERIGVAWNREDGGIGVRFAGTQVIDNDVYLYPNEPRLG